ncbi:unnamed protein product [Enterobius vermicularis]|uniref:Uncharacterized protein n=1 Tax=Enterobius vermicularis TaxID=51028 RepID=A0A0N4VG47_ENTVE|nr:unnamed protein product [Enterobius vermicularis]
MLFGGDEVLLNAANSSDFTAVGVKVVVYRSFLVFDVVEDGVDADDVLDVNAANAAATIGVNGNESIGGDFVDNYGFGGYDEYGECAVIEFMRLIIVSILKMDDSIAYIAEKVVVERSGKELDELETGIGEEKGIKVIGEDG